MSWSVDSVGKASKVAEKLEKDFTSYKCSEPEESIRQKIAEAISIALSNFPPDVAVKVSASGSQSTNTKFPGKASNSLVVRIEEMWGFVE